MFKEELGLYYKKQLEQEIKVNGTQHRHFQFSTELFMEFYAETSGTVLRNQFTTATQGKFIFEPRFARVYSDLMNSPVEICAARAVEE